VPQPPVDPTSPDSRSGRWPCGRSRRSVALRWSDVDMDRSRLRISGTLTRLNGQLVTTEPKTASSRRWRAALPESAAPAQHSATGAGGRSSACGQHLGKEQHGLTTASGEPMDPRNVLRAVTDAARQIGLDGVTVHTLRHSAATLSLECGVHLKGVSSLLGHANIRITAETYAHLSDDAARSALTRLSQSLAAPSRDVGVSVGVKRPQRANHPLPTTLKMPLTRGDAGGRYWDRTSDLFRVSEIHPPGVAPTRSCLSVDTSCWVPVHTLVVLHQLLHRRGCRAHHPACPRMTIKPEPMVAWSARRI
jgi:hypothetical protein